MADKSYFVKYINIIEYNKYHFFFSHKVQYIKYHKGPNHRDKKLNIELE